MSGLMVILGLVALVLVASGWSFIILREQKTLWNNGICEINGLPWKYRTYDDHLGHCYYAGDECLWIA